MRLQPVVSEKGHLLLVHLLPLIGYRCRYPYPLEETKLPSWVPVPALVAVPAVAIETKLLERLGQWVQESVWPYQRWLTLLLESKAR